MCAEKSCGYQSKQHCCGTEYECTEKHKGERICEREDCKDCYGAQSSSNQCCNECEDVVRAYQLREWSLDRTKFLQCTNVTRKYDCIKKGCLRTSKLKKGVDWGHFSNPEGDCQYCKIECESNSTCGGYECGTEKCIWWKVGKCSLLDSNTDKEMAAVLSH